VESIERIRSATFTLARRGYDRREVDNYLSKLADWLEGGGADQVHSDSIRHELERIGQKTSSVLTAAQEAAESMRGEAERQARQITEDARAHVESTRAAADDYAKKVRDEAQSIAGKAKAEAEAEAREVRQEADDHAKRVRSEADADADRAIKEAEAKAIKMVEEGSRRRREIEKVIADLQTRRDAVVRGLEKLSSQLAGAATQGKGFDPAAKPAGSQPPPSSVQPAVGAQPPASAKTTNAQPPAPTRQ
jgi:DivIVA domain-containing protein